MKTLRTILSLSTLCVLFAGTTLEAAVTLRTIGSGGTSGSTVTVPVTVTGFSSKLSMQFSLEWDETVLTFQSIGSLGLPNAAESDFNIAEARVTTGVLAMAWVTPDGSAHSVADGTVVVEVTFNIIGATGTSSEVRFVDSPTATLIDDEPPEKAQGAVTVETPDQVVVNTKPTISTIPDQTVTQDNTTDPISFTVGDAETAAASLTVSRTSSNTGVVLVQDIVLGGSGANRTVTITPVSGKSGSAAITLTVSDSGGKTAGASFVLTVTGGNTPPTITNIGNQVIWDGAASSFAFTVGDEQTSADQLSVTAASSNTEVISASSLTFPTETGANRTLVVTPEAGKLGVTLVTLTVKDSDQGETTDTFLITVAKRRIYVEEAGDGEFNVMFNSFGDEDAITFSLNYDPALIAATSVTSENIFLDPPPTNPANIGDAASTGKFGVTLNPGQNRTFSAGTQSLMTVAFNRLGPDGSEVNINFVSNQPTINSASDKDGIALDIAFIPGQIVLSSGLEGDVTGDGVVAANDWSQVGLLLLGTQLITSASQFQRADVADSTGDRTVTKGDGVLAANDWTVVGLFILLNERITAGGPAIGPSSQSLVQSSMLPRFQRDPAYLRGNIVKDGSDVLFRVSLESYQEVAALGFSLRFDSDQLLYRGMRLSELPNNSAPELPEPVIGVINSQTWVDDHGAVSYVNDKLESHGKVGVVIARPPGRSFESGKKQLVEFRFEMRDFRNGLGRGIDFSDSPAVRNVSSVIGESVNTVYVIDGDFITAPEVLNAQMRGGDFELDIQAEIGKSVLLEASEDLANWRLIWRGEVPESGLLRITDDGSDQSAVRFYRLRAQAPLDLEPAR